MHVSGIFLLIKMGSASFVFMHSLSGRSLKLSPLSRQRKLVHLYHTHNFFSGFFFPLRISISYTARKSSNTSSSFLLFFFLNTCIATHSLCWWNSESYPECQLDPCGCKPLLLFSVAYYRTWRCQLQCTVLPLSDRILLTENTIV